MTSIIAVPYMIPLFLGMTYDARYSKPGVDIYDAQYVNDPAITTFGKSESVYTVTSNMSDVTKALGIDGELSLKIKTGMINVEGKGSYLKNERDFNNKVEILTTLKYTASVHSFKQEAKPRADWTKLHSVGVLGTHYVSSVTYGAELIASARFVVFDSSDISVVKGAVEGALNLGGNATDLVANGTLDKLTKTLAGKANLEISYYGTVPLKTIPNTLEGLKTLIENFDEQIKEANLQDGIPMYVNFEPLTSIAPPDIQDKFEFLKNEALDDALKNFEEKFDELREARLDLSAWAKALPYELPTDTETQIGALLKNITLVSEVFYETIWNMDLTKDETQLQPALSAYDYSGRPSFRRFANRVNNLKKKLGPTLPRGEVASDVFIHWGSNECSAPETELLYSGFVVSSVEVGIGGTAKYECAPKEGKTGYDLKSGSEHPKSELAGIRYTEFDKASNPFKGPFSKKVPGKGVPCSKCYSPDSADIAMFPASDSCPLTWQFMYQGYLVSARNQGGHTTEYICLDEEPTAPYNMQSEPNSKDTVALTTVQSKGSLPSDKFKEGALVRCVVCSMTANQVTF